MDEQITESYKLLEQLLEEIGKFTNDSIIKVEKHEITAISVLIIVLILTRRRGEAIGSNDPVFTFGRLSLSLAFKAGGHLRMILRMDDLQPPVPVLDHVVARRFIGQEDNRARAQRRKFR